MTCLVTAWLVALLGAGLGRASGLESHLKTIEADQAACIQQLRLPTYPPLAAAARVRASVAVHVTIGKSGAVQLSSSAALATLFESSIRDALSKSIFDEACGGRQVVLTSADGKDAVVVGYPMEFWIFVKAPSVQP